MQSIFRNFISMLRHYRMASTLNILGLSVAFFVFLVLMLKVSYELNYDKFHPDADRIYKLTFQGETQTSEILARGNIDAFIASSPHVVAGTALMPKWSGDSYLTYEKGGQKIGFKSGISQTDVSITEVFGFKMVSGERDCLKAPDGILIPKSIEDRHFDGDAMGKSMVCEDELWGNTPAMTSFTVVGVYQDFPANTLLENDIYKALDSRFQKGDYSSANFMGYVRLDDPANAQMVSDNFVANYHEESWQKPVKAPLILLSDIYLDDPQTRSTIRLLIMVAALIIVIAAINFTNFATSMAPIRMRSINTRKVFGVTNGELRAALVFEGIFTSLLSLSLALLLVYVTDKLKWLALVSPDIHLSYGLWPILLTFALSLLTGLIAGIWPAMYVTSFSPAMVLKGSFGLSSKGKHLRTALICFQYFISSALIIAALCMQTQNKYISNYDLGFVHDGLAIVEMSDAHASRYDYLVNTLKESPMIEDVGFASAKIGLGDSFRSEGCSYKNEDFNFASISVSENLLQMLEIPLLEGRWATKSEFQNNAGLLFVDKRSQDALSMHPGENLSYYRGSTIVGVVDNISLKSLRSEPSNNLFIVGERTNTPLSNAYIKLAPGVDKGEATRYIYGVLGQLDAIYPFELKYYDTMIDSMYASENLFIRVIGLLGFLAILISIVGVFGMVMIETQYRKKEIGIRRVMGSTIEDILKLFNKKYLIISTVCSIVAAPAAYYAVMRWSEDFIYRAPIQFWPFAVAFLTVVFISIFTVTLQSWKTATENPVESLRLQ